MSHPLKILPRAEEDFRSIYAYIEQRSPSGAIRWRDAFGAAMQSVAQNPAASGLAPEDVHTEFELRQASFKTRRGLTYRAVFTVVDGEVLVLRLRGPGQPPLASDEVPIA